MKHKNAIISSIIFILFFAWYASIPDYDISNSIITSTSNHTETTLKVDVHKAFFNPYLYTEIAENYNSDNAMPDKLTMQLYFFNQKYRTVVFDYANHVEYILLDYINLA